jgi:hypothetical protein
LQTLNHKTLNSNINQFLNIPFKNKNNKILNLNGSNFELQTSREGISKHELKNKFK